MARQKKYTSLVGHNKSHSSIALQERERKAAARLQKQDALRAARSRTAEVVAASTAPVDRIADALSVIDPEEGALKWVRIRGFRPWPCVVISFRQVPTASCGDVLRAERPGHALVFTFGNHLFYWAPRTHLNNWIDKKADFFPKAFDHKISKSFQQALKEASAAEARPGLPLPL